MSAELKKFLEDRFIPVFNKDESTLPAHLQEEYLTPEGWLDKNYLCKSLKVHMSTATFRKVIKQVFGTAQFVLEPTETEAEKEEFVSIYEFGKHTNARAWVGEFYELTGKVIKREDALKWIYSS